MKLEIIKKYSKYIIINLLILFYYAYRTYSSYNELKQRNDSILLEISELNNNYENLENRINVKENYEIDFNDKYIVGEEFIKMIHVLSNESKLKLIDSSSPVEKLKDNKTTLQYITFRFVGDFKSFYEFMYYVYNTSLYIDTTYTDIHIYEDNFEISIGYLKEEKT